MLSKNWCTLTLVVLAIIFCTDFLRCVSGIECVIYDYKKCKDDRNACNRTKEVCSEEQLFCFSSWKWDDTLKKMDMHIQSCWATADFAGKNKCDVKVNKDLYWCWCRTDLCNSKQNIVFDAQSILNSTNTTETTDEEPPYPYNQQPNMMQPLVYSFIVIVAVSIIITAAYWIYRKNQSSYMESVPCNEPIPTTPSTPLLGLKPIQLIEVKARGRFGAVWKAQCMTEVVAVKIFPLQDKLSWHNEREIFNLPGMKHENLLNFIASEKRGENLNMDFWLISEFHEKGSLYDYLKGNLLSSSELLHLAETMSRGLAYLHEDIPASRISEHKPAIAHRDFKSRNVLIKSDMSACVADFGLAMQFDPCKSLGDAHGQVGTRRYMAPEVLEGAINFNRDSFLRIDMYACGLVLWEMVNRCKTIDGPVPDYQLPFEDEVGLHPSLEDMQDLVVQKRSRPPIKDIWLRNPMLQSMCVTIEECWDHDAEARLSAGCIEERVVQLSKNSTSTMTSDYNGVIPSIVMLPNNNDISVQIAAESDI